jgi:hypothetical protein
LKIKPYASAIKVEICLFSTYYCDLYTHTKKLLKIQCQTEMFSA